MWIRIWQFSAKSLLLHPLRSSLTVLGIFIGVASVVWLLAIGEGISAKAQEQIAKLGARNVILRSIKPSGEQAADGTYGLTRQDYVRVLATVPHIERAVPIREVRREFRYRTRYLDGRLVGSTPDYATTSKLRVAAGQFLTDTHLREELNVCVLAHETAIVLFPFENPIGESVRADSEVYTVIGVMEPRAPSAGIGGSLAAEDYSKDVYIPISSLWRRIGDITVIRRPGSFQRDIQQLSQITFEVDDVDYVPAAAEAIQEAVAINHTLPDFGVTVPLELLEQARTTRLMFIVFLGLIAAISLVVGGIGIMNIMLATVTERTREIGIRRALGAKRRDITRQFLAETVLLSIAGGVLGILGGLLCRPITVLARKTIAEWRPDLMDSLPEAIQTVEPLVVPWSIPLAFAISVGVGVVFGVYPAMRAAKMDPIEALRHE